jgi:hypothetical protein
MEEGGSSRSERGEEYIHEGMKYIPCMKRMEWSGKKCELVNHIGKMIVEGRIVACDPKEPILDNNPNEIDVGVIILSCANDRSQIMSIWRWPLSQTILDGHCLLSFLVAYQ